MRGGCAIVLYQPVTPQTEAIVRPLCSKCGAKTWLSRIEPDSPGHEKRTFECPACDSEISEVAKFR